MSDEQAIEAQGPDVEAAIEAGLQRLGLSRSDVIVEVVEEGRKGLLGLGSKDAIVRLTPLGSPQPREKDAGAQEAPAPVREPQTSVPEALREEAPSPASVETAETEETDVSDEDADEETVRVAREIVTNLLQKMGYEEATVRLERSEPDDRTGRVMTVLHVEGENLSGLIGPHGETLNDFQYVARLMAGHALRRRADFLVDVDGYRSQRKESLRSLAKRMATKAVERGSPVTLEPMSSYDRRLVHIALRDHDEVYTSSVGEGSNRRVRIYLKQYPDAE
ncbi:MAG: RNA-binding cell elongation regulator Jag/EloR [Chloroflexota bacterium]